MRAPENYENSVSLGHSSLSCLLFCFILYLLEDYDEPEILSYAISSICPVGPDGKRCILPCD